MPRRLLVTPEMQHRYSAMIGVGCSRRYAAALLGLNESTIRTAMRRDPKFADEVRQSEQRREIVPLRNIQTACRRSWRANVWFLERLNPGEYRRSGDNEPTFPLDFDDASNPLPNDDRSPGSSSPMQSDLPDREGP